MMAMRRRFEGSFGFNPTILTEVLQEKDYDSAENIIRSTIDATYLNDGRYQEIPFFLVLSNNNRPRNLYLASLLLSYGADPSLRVPVIGREDSTIRGQSAIDLLVDYFIEISNTNANNTTLKDDEKWLDYLKEHKVIDLYQRTTVAYGDLRSQILYLLSDCLEFPEFDTYDPVLLRVMKSAPDLDLVKLLCGNGANINVRDNHGRTPLFYLCHSPKTDEQVLDYVLSLPSVELNNRDCQGYSTLFLCCAHQRLNFARKLLEKDASASILGRITAVPYNEAGEKPINNDNCIIVSPLWAACLCTTEESSWMRKKSLTDAAKAWVAGCVDSGFFNTSEITSELWYLINMAVSSYEVHCNLNHLDKLNQELVPLMFGRLTCSLQQLSVNAIASHVCQLHRNKSNAINKFLEDSRAAASFKVYEKDSAKESAICGDEDRKMFLLLQRLPKLLKLPEAFNTRFEIEAVKFLIFKMLDMYCWPVVCKEGCENEDAFYDDDLFDFELSDLSDSSESVDFEM